MISKKQFEEYKELASRGLVHEIPTPLRKNREIVLAAITHKGSLIEWADSIFHKDLEIMKIAISNYPMAIFRGSEEIKDNTDIVIDATKKDSRAFIACSSRIKNSKEIILQLTSVTEIAQHISHELQDDEDVCKGFIANRGYFVRFFSERLRNKPEIMILAMESGGDTVFSKFAGNELKDKIGSNDPMSGLRSIILKEELESSVCSNTLKIKKNKI